MMPDLDTDLARSGVVHEVRSGASREGQPHVYFLRADGMDDRVKIGWTSGPTRSRLAELQTGSPVPLVPLFHFLGDMDLEKMMHREFSEHRLRGEWFLVEGRVHEFISGCVEVMSRRKGNGPR